MPESKSEINRLSFFYLLSKSEICDIGRTQYRKNKSKNRNGKIVFSFVSAHCASVMKGGKALTLARTTPKDALDSAAGLAKRKQAEGEAGSEVVLPPQQPC